MDCGAAPETTAQRAYDKTPLRKGIGELSVNSLNAAPLRQVVHADLQVTILVACHSTSTTFALAKSSILAVNQRSNVRCD